MAAVTLKNVIKRFGVFEIVHGANIDIDDGEFVVFVGPSGCGKSTLLRMIAGLEDISDGEIAIGGKVVNDVEAADRGIAMVFQSYALYPHMDVSKNMGFSLMLRKAGKPAIDARVDGAAKRLGLDALLQRLPRQLSGGQRQRVAMGRAIVRDPKVFLFDEPLSNLDAKLRVHMRAEIKALHQQLKTTSVYVTHDQTEAMTMADRIVVMHDGLVQQVGAPLDLYDRPVNTFVAGFIGSPGMNFLPAVVEKGAKPDAVLADGQKLRLPDGLPLRDGDAITVGLRPEHIRLADNGALKGEVGVVEPLGLSTQFYARLAGQQVCVFAMGRASVKPGEAVRLSADPASLHLFDPASGGRIG
ncbi:MAG: sn-glycerol-3-phosphate ABC transporter ATP-binding protein UgpC [Mesorhizobium sp.]|nr:MAG: sn-glycerol-3-phosphate ABC transporter ATP-binding protein UgpC [Mesorhizobium sp.]